MDKPVVKGRRVVLVWREIGNRAFRIEVGCCDECSFMGDGMIMLCVTHTLGHETAQVRA